MSFVKISVNTLENFKSRFSLSRLFALYFISIALIRDLDRGLLFSQISPNRAYQQTSQGLSLTLSVRLIGSFCRHLIQGYKFDGWRFLDRISPVHRQCGTSARHYGRGPLCGSVDRVCIGVGGPIDFLAHVKAAREKLPFSSDHPQPTTIPFDLPRLFPLPCRLCVSSSSLVFDSRVQRVAPRIHRPAFFDLHH